MDGAEPINVRTRLDTLRTWKRFGLREGVYSASYGALAYVGTRASLAFNSRLAVHDSIKLDLVRLLFSKPGHCWATARCHVQECSSQN